MKYFHIMMLRIMFTDITHCTFSVSCLQPTWTRVILLNQLLGFLLGKSVLCIVPDNLSCTIRNPPFTCVMNVYAISGTPTRYLKTPDKIQRKVCKIIGPDLTSQLQSHSHCHDIPVFSTNIFIGIALMSFPPWYPEHMNLSVLLNWEQDLTISLFK